MGFVKKIVSPIFALVFLFSWSIFTIPVTDKPNIGSGESILCPPARVIPAILQISLPPSITCDPISAESSLIGQPNIAIAINGFPPIA